MNPLWVWVIVGTVGWLVFGTLWGATQDTDYLFKCGMSFGMAAVGAAQLFIDWISDDEPEEKSAPSRDAQGNIIRETAS